MSQEEIIGELTTLNNNPTKTAVTPPPSAAEPTSPITPVSSPPSGPAERNTSEMSEDERCRFIRQKYFPQLRKDVAHMNHGSFGVVPNVIQACVAKNSLEWQSATDHVHYNFLMLDKMKASVNAVGPIVNAKMPYTNHMCLIDNATTGANIIAQSLMWKFVYGEYKPGDVILMWEVAYGSIQYVFRHYLERLGAKFVKVPLPWPLDNLTGEEAKQRLLDAFRTSLDSVNGAPIRMVLMEQTASKISLSFPVRELAQLCRSYPNVGIIYCDAAHALGNEEIDLQQLDVDFYVSNCHKWFFNPHSCAIFYSKLPFHHDKVKDFDLHHPIVSWQWGTGILRECYWTGTRDNSTRVVLPDIIDFLPVLAREMNLVPQTGSVPPKEALRAIQAHNRTKLREDAKILSDAWQAGCGMPPELMSCMGMVAFPRALNIDSEQKAEQLRMILLNEYKIAMVPYALPCEEKQADGSVKRVYRGYTRICHQVYVTKADVEQYRDAVLDLVQKGWQAEE